MTTSFWRVRFVLSLLLLLAFQYIALGYIPYVKISPRKELLSVLAPVGCTNALVANIVIDAVTFNIPVDAVKARLANIPGVKDSDVAKISDYMKTLTAYLAAKKK